MRLPHFALAFAVTMTATGVQVRFHPVYAQAPDRFALTGQVTSDEEGRMEGVLVRAKKTGSTIAITVVTDAQGRYQFPRQKLDAGRYALSIRAVGYDLASDATVEVEGASAATLDLKLQKTRDLAAQLTNAERIVSAPGTEQQKNMFRDSCVRCHTVSLPLQSRYDADKFMDVLERMRGYLTSAFPRNPQRRPAGEVVPFDQLTDEQKAARRRDAEYLASINLGPTGQWRYELKTFPRPSGRATRVVITEYDLPDRSRQPHDAVLDPSGTVWYADFGKQFIGKLDPKTGLVKEYPVPVARPGLPTGILGVDVDHEGNLWFGNMFQGAIHRFTPSTEKFQTWMMPEVVKNRQRIDGGVRTYGAGMYWTNMVQARNSHVDGKVWFNDRALDSVQRLDLATGKIEVFEPFRESSLRNAVGYDVISDSRNNAWITDYGNQHIAKIDAKTGKTTWYETPTPDSAPRRGSADSQDRIWFGEFNGNKIGMFDPKTNRFQEWEPPLPWTRPYDVVVDKNGEAWTGSMHNDRVWRLDPKTGQFVGYLLPSSTNIRRVFVDNSTTPVTFWVGSNHGAAIIKLEPLD